MKTALVIGGTRFIGRHVVAELLDYDYEVDVFTRGRHAIPFPQDSVEHHRGDRGERSALEATASEVSPDVVVDTVAYEPEDVRIATEVFADTDAYVYVSSSAAYEPDAVPKVEGITPLRECTDAQAVDESHDSYGARKAEGDRVVFSAAADGVAAYSVRPCSVYGPFDYTGRYDYWIDRIDRYDRVVIPGEGTNNLQNVYVEDVASAIRLVIERGTPGEAYNVAEHRFTSLVEMCASIENTIGTSTEFVPACERSLATEGLTTVDFPLYRSYPFVLSAEKLSGLGWSPVPMTDAIEPTIEEFFDSDRSVGDRFVDRADERAILGTVDREP